MADYNIYIHTVGFTGRSGATNHTIPWSQQEDENSGSQNTTSWLGTASKIISAASNPDSLVSSAMGKVMKAAPVVVVAYGVIKLATSIYDNVLQFQTIEGGDYSQLVNRENFKASMNVIFHPFSTTLNVIRQEKQWRVENQRRSMQRELLGDSVINSYTNRGI